MASDRAVIFIQGAFGGGLPRVSLEEPATHPDATTGLDLNYLPLAQLFNLMKTGPCLPDVVEQVGKTLYNLIGRHPAIAADFVTRFDPGNQNEGPIYLRLESEDVENLPWEALNEVRNGFIAMDRRWPIARLKRVAQSKAKAEYLFLPPLKIMAVMGASGQDAFTQISALAELIKLKDAVEQSGLNVVLRVLVCEDQLKSTIENWNHDWMQVAFIVDDDKLFQEIASFEPQLLHFFCHGVADTPPYLEIGNRVNWIKKEAGSVHVEANQLAQRADLNQNVWLITLNCCESAQQAAGGGARSAPLASSLVASGFPAVLGMRDKVDSVHANNFCGQFYSEVLQVLKTRLQQNPSPANATECHWATALYSARQTICRLVDGRPLAQAARGVKEWTAPVLYVRNQPFGVRLTPDPDGLHSLLRSVVPPPPVPPKLSLKEKLELTAEMQQLLTQRDSLANLPQAVRDNVLHDIEVRLAEIEKQLS